MIIHGFLGRNSPGDCVDPSIFYLTTPAQIIGQVTGQVCRVYCVLCPGQDRRPWLRVKWDQPLGAAMYAGNRVLGGSCGQQGLQEPVDNGFNLTSLFWPRGECLALEQLMLRQLAPGSHAGPLCWQRLPRVYSEMSFLLQL